MLDDLALDEKTLALSDGINVALGNIVSVTLLTKVFNLFLGSRHPEGIFIQHLKALKDELRTGSTRSSLADFI